MKAILFIGDDLQPDLEAPQHQLILGGLTLVTRCLRTLARAGVSEIFALAPERDLETLQRDATRDHHFKSQVHWFAHSARYQDATQALKRHVESLPDTAWLLSADRLVTGGLFALPTNETTDVSEEASEEASEDSHLAHAPITSIADESGDVGIFWLDHGLASLLPDAPSPLSALVSPEAPRHIPAKPIWAPVTRRDDFKYAQRQLTRMLRKPMARTADGLTSYWVNRPISLQMSKHLVNTPLTPNHVTAIALLLGLLAAWFVSYGSWFELALGGVLLQVSSIVDGVDGELARMRLTSSRFGEWFDTVSDTVVNISFLAGISHAAYQLSSASYVAYFGISTLVVTIIGVVIIYVDLIRAGKASHNSIEWDFEQGEKTFITRVFSGFALIAKRDTYTLILMCLTIANLPLVAFWVMSIGAMIIGLASVIQKTLHLMR